ncbi:MAG: signal peptidase I [Gemmatimonadales bacterium]
MTDGALAGVTPTPGQAAFSEERRQVALHRANRRGFRWRMFRDWAQSFVIALALFFVLRAFFIEGIRIASGSMEQTLLVGDFLLLNKLAYGAEVPFTAHRLPALEHPQRRDVILFRPPADPRTYYIKRVVGLPGDTVAMKDGVLSVDGEPQAEPYVVHLHPSSDQVDVKFRWQRQFLVRSAAAAARSYDPTSNNWGPLVVPERSYFVLGDNRDNSFDSRHWGFVPASSIEGRPIFVYYSYAPDSASRLPQLTRVRWHRIGERVE